MSSETQLILSEADSTLNLSRQVLGLLKERDFAMGPRQASELYLYLEAFQISLENQKAEIETELAKQNTTADSLAKLLAAYRFELEDAIRYAQEAFIKPRRSGGEQQVLEAADWVCVEGFKLFLDQSNIKKEDMPIGPLVALDSQRSPAVWKEGSQLRLPSLFGSSIPKKSGGTGAHKKINSFPIICLPADLALLPEYYPLLSHEVGHAVDNAVGFSESTLQSLKTPQHIAYWRAWMREIIADTIGLAISGEAFALALYNFIQREPYTRDLTHSHPYPPTTLRLHFLRLILEALDPSEGKVYHQLPNEKELEQFPKRALELKKEFQTLILPILTKLICETAPNWAAQQESIRLLAQDLNTPHLDHILFRQLPSALTLASHTEPNIDTRKQFRSWHDTFTRERSPTWIKESTNWKFSEDYISTLRPTHLGTDGRTKIPPLVLLATHDSIALVGATHKWLLAALQEAITIRENKPWKQLDLYFASHALLEQINSFEMTTAQLVKEQNEHRKGLKKFCLENQGMIKKVNFHLFDGPPIFASYWDWEKLGGRIHVSPQLHGTDISECPSVDHLWTQDTPSYEYDCYRKHLDSLREKSRGITTTPLT